MHESKITSLFEKYIAQTASEEELEAFYEIIRNRSQDEHLKNELAQHWLTYTTAHELPTNTADDLFNAILQQEAALQGQDMRMFSIHNWKRLAVAAVVIMAFATGSFLFFNRMGIKPDLAKKTILETYDVAAPLNNQAVITMANGEKIYVNNAGKGQIASQGSVNVVKLADGEIKYTDSALKQAANLQYNTLSNPRGSKVIRITLADGSKVWLNAGSSLTYPVAFTGNERKVSINGEGYFEVTHNKSMPFKVNKDETAVTVLGTYFNVNAYDDEPTMKITPLEGAVKVTAGKAGAEKVQLLSTGQQTQVSKKGNLKLIADADVDETMAWKNGKFIFTGNDIRSVMQQLEKWYDIEVVYQGSATKEEFVGVISRDVNISQILQMLEKTAAVKFDVTGKKVIIKS